MPRAFLITNKRYRVQPYPPTSSSSSTSPSSSSTSSSSSPLSSSSSSLAAVADDRAPCSPERPTSSESPLHGGTTTRHSPPAHDPLSRQSAAAGTREASSNHLPGTAAPLSPPPLTAQSSHQPPPPPLSDVTPRAPLWYPGPLPYHTALPHEAHIARPCPSYPLKSAQFVPATSPPVNMYRAPHPPLTCPDSTLPFSPLVPGPLQCLRDQTHSINEHKLRLFPETTKPKTDVIHGSVERDVSDAPRPLPETRRPSLERPSLERSSIERPCLDGPLRAFPLPGERLPRSPDQLPAHMPYLAAFPSGLSHDLRLSPLKASSPSMSPTKPRSPAHTSPLTSPLRPGAVWPALATVLRFTEHDGLRCHSGLGEMPSPPESCWDEGAGEDGEGEHPCPDCGKTYSTSSNLARHRQTHRSVTDKKARKCPHCDKVYVSMPAYSMHVRTHSQGCECAYCGKRFSRPWLLQGHIRTHTGEKPFNCSQCGKSFADKSNLRAHIQTHSTDKPYVCGRCGKAFALKSYLYKHEESSCMRGQRALHRSYLRHA